MRQEISYLRSTKTSECSIGRKICLAHVTKYADIWNKVTVFCMENSSLHHLHKNDKNGGYTSRRSRQFPETSVLSPRIYRSVAESTYLIVSSTFFFFLVKIITKYFAIFQLSCLELQRKQIK